MTPPAATLHGEFVDPKTGARNRGEVYEYDCLCGTSFTTTNDPGIQKAMEQLTDLQALHIPREKIVEGEALCPRCQKVSRFMVTGPTGKVCAECYANEVL